MGITLLERPRIKGECFTRCDDCPSGNPFPPEDSDCPHFLHGEQGAFPGCDQDNDPLSLEKRTLDFNFLDTLERSGKLPNILPPRNS